MRTSRSTSGHRAHSTVRIRRMHRGPLGWLREGQLRSGDNEIWSHPAGQWRF